MAEEIIRAEDLRKSFDAQTALDGVSFSLRQGETLGIIGTSGSGKSTLLRCVTGLEFVDDGTISICGETFVTCGDYVDDDALRATTLKVGLVFQNFNLFPHFSVLKNIADPQIRALKKSKDEAEGVAMALLDRVGLAQKALKYPCELSGGQKQRVAIARALAMRPRALFFDEPTSALDPELTGEVLAIIKDLAKDKMTMIVVTHEMAFARDTSDFVMFMDNGAVVESGESAQVIGSPREERTKAFLSRFNS